MADHAQASNVAGNSVVPSMPTSAQLQQAYQAAYGSAYLAQQQQQPLQTAQQSNADAEELKAFWQQQMKDVEQVPTDDLAFFKNHQLPLARIKKIMKSDEDVRMISAEAPVLFAKACEMFILELTMRAWHHAEENKRRTLQRNDVAAAITRTDIFDFLVDVVPREDVRPEGAEGAALGCIGASAAAAAAASAVAGMQPGVGAPAGMALPQGAGHMGMAYPPMGYFPMAPPGDASAMMQPAMAAMDPAQASQLMYQTQLMAGLQGAQWSGAGMPQVPVVPQVPIPPPQGGDANQAQ